MSVKIHPRLPSRFPAGRTHSAAAHAAAQRIHLVPFAHDEGRGAPLLGCLAGCGGEGSPTGPPISISRRFLSTSLARSATDDLDSAGKAPRRAAQSEFSSSVIRCLNSGCGRLCLDHAVDVHLAGNLLHLC